MSGVHEVAAHPHARRSVLNNNLVLLLPARLSPLCPPSSFRDGPYSSASSSCAAAAKRWTNHLSSRRGSRRRDRPGSQVRANLILLPPSLVAPALRTTSQTLGAWKPLCGLIYP